MAQDRRDVGNRGRFSDGLWKPCGYRCTFPETTTPGIRLHYIQCFGIPPSLSPPIILSVLLNETHRRLVLPAHEYMCRNAGCCSNSGYQLGVEGRSGPKQCCQRMASPTVVVCLLCFVLPTPGAQQYQLPRPSPPAQRTSAFTQWADCCCGMVLWGATAVPRVTVTLVPHLGHSHYRPS